MSDILFRLPEIYESAVNMYNSICEKSAEAEFVPVEEAGDGSGTVVRGDNLKYMRYLLDRGYEGKLDLIYIDPPFFSKSDYKINVKVGNKSKQLTLARTHAFSDRWADGMDEYLREMTVRLLMMRRLLSDTGSIFVHLDWHSSHYMKILLDQIFGRENFINEIIWNYKSGGVSNRYYARKHDVILFYAKSDRYYFSPQKEKSYNRGLKPYRFKGVKEYCDEVGWYTLVNMKDVWQVDMVGRTSSERTGYATQKPEAVIERILASAVPEGGLCADFFCGSGTLGASCEKLGLRYILCDNGGPAVMTAHKRLVKKGTGHVLYNEVDKSGSAIGNDNFRPVVSVTPLEGVIETTSVSIDGVSYESLEDLGIEEKNRDLMKTIINNHYGQLIDYWCVDFDYDGKVIRPGTFAYSEKGDIDLAVVLPTKRIKRLAVRVVDVFGNEYTYERDD